MTDEERIEWLYDLICEDKDVILTTGIEKGCRCGGCYEYKIKIPDIDDDNLKEIGGSSFREAIDNAAILIKLRRI